MSAAAASSTAEKPSQASIDSKILQDLASVKEKMDVCDNMLHPGDGSPAPSLKNNEALLGVIGFLEACAPRMVELVEAATSGALGEAVLMECLTVNDRLLKLLSDIDTYAFTETPATTTAAAAPPALNQQFGDLLLDDSSAGSHKDAPPTPIMGGKTTGEEDPFASAPIDVLSPTPMAESNMKSPPASTADAKPAPLDDFDDFFASRTGS